jgi:hypothetical protein
MLHGQVKRVRLTERGSYQGICDAQMHHPVDEQPEASGVGSTRTTMSFLELHPTELLERVFFHRLNLNLLKAYRAIQRHLHDAPNHLAVTVYASFDPLEATKTIVGVRDFLPTLFSRLEFGHLMGRERLKATARCTL